MKFLKFICQKIIILEIMILILHFSIYYFNLNIPLLTPLIETTLTILTPLAILLIIPYLILCILTNTIIEIALGVVLGGLILHYLQII